MGIEFGMNPDPGQCYSIQSRLVCATCWIEPRVLKAEGKDVLTITCECHGERETRMIPRGELVYTQKFFVPPGGVDV